MSRTNASALFLVLPLAAACGTNVPDGTPSCADASSCPGEAIPESACLEHLAADELDDGCGVFVAGWAGGGDDANPGTKAKPVFSVQHAVELARIGRGRVFICSDGFVGPVTVPSGVDLFGGFNCWLWGRDNINKVSLLQQNVDEAPAITVEPASPSDVGAADGVSTLADLSVSAWGPIAVFIRSNTAVEIIRNEVRTFYGYGGREGAKWPSFQAADGPDGLYGGDVCSAATVTGGAAVMSSCDDGVVSIGGKGGDGLPDGGDDGDDGAPRPAPNPTNSGIGGRGGIPSVGCSSGVDGISGARGTDGIAGEGIGRISEAGFEAGWAGDAGRGMPGQGGGGGGGRHGGLAECGTALKGGPGGGSGGAGGCGGRGGKGGENGKPSIGLLALHARVTVRDGVIRTKDGGHGGHGGEPEDGGEGGRGAPGGAFEQGTNYSCQGGSGGRGGPGGFGGGGRGGDSIGIAYLDEDQLTLERVTFELGAGGKGGESWSEDPAKSGADGSAYEKLRFLE